MQSNIKTIVLRESNDIDKAIAHSPNSSENEIFSSLHNPFFKSPINGEYIFLDLIESTIEDRKIFLIENKNRQYQWLLAEAYELYEDFLEKLYANIAYIDPSLWPLGNYGNSYLEEINDQELDFFIEKSKKKDVKHILKNLRKKFPQLKKYEADNALNIDYKLFIQLIENLRHIIVHNKGLVLSQKSFVESIFEKIGLSSQSKNAKDKKAEISRFFEGNGEEPNQIRLLELKANPKSFRHDDRLGFLLDVLMTHAHIVYIALPNVLKIEKALIEK